MRTETAFKHAFMTRVGEISPSMKLHSRRHERRLANRDLQQRLHDMLFEPEHDQDDLVDMMEAMHATDAFDTWLDEQREMSRFREEEYYHPDDFDDSFYDDLEYYYHG